jgi:putative spermidine/putrescine transport system permease protein
MKPASITRSYAFVLPAAALILVLFAYPVGWLLLRSVSTPRFGLQNYVWMVEHPVYLRALLNTVEISGVSTICCALIGYPLAYKMATASPRGRTALGYLVLVPFWTSVLVRTFAWMVLLQRLGLVNQLLLRLGLVSQPLPLLYNRLGTLIGMVQILLPFMVFPLVSVMLRINPIYTRAAATLGAGPFRAALRIYLPLSLPGLWAGSTLVFIIALGYFITPALLGGPGRRCGADRRPARGDGAHPIRRPADLQPARRVDGSMSAHSGSVGRWRGVLLWTVCGIAACYLVAPLAIVVVLSFSSAEFLTFPPPGFSLHWYRRLVDDPNWADAAVTSIKIVIPTALLATTLGTLAAYGTTRMSSRAGSAVSSLLLAPVIVPAIVTAAAIYGLFQAIGLYGTVTGFILAHTVLTLPYVFITVSAALRMLDPRLEAAAATLGAPPGIALRRIVLPLVSPAILSGLLFALVVSFDELVVSLFISTPEVRPLTVQMWSDVMGDVDPTITAVASLLLCASLLALGVRALVQRSLHHRRSRRFATPRAASGAPSQ